MIAMAHVGGLLAVLAATAALPFSEPAAIACPPSARVVRGVEGERRVAWCEGVGLLGETEKQGTRLTWYLSGQLASSEQYHLGHLEGLTREWHANGVLARRGTYLRGARVGEWLRWDDRGTLIGREICKRGVCHAVDIALE